MEKEMIERLENLYGYEMSWNAPNDRQYSICNNFMDGEEYYTLGTGRPSILTKYQVESAILYLGLYDSLEEIELVEVYKITEAYKVNVGDIYAKE